MKEEIALIEQIISHKAGFDVDLPIDGITVGRSGEKYSVYYDGKTKYYKTARNAAKAFVEIRYRMKLGDDYIQHRN